MDATGFAFRDFLIKFTRTVDLGTGLALSLLETTRFDCIFWEDGCTVYASRPLQCSTYPFWERIVESRQTWEEEAKDCPGMETGPCISLAVINDYLSRRRKDPPLIIRYGYTLETIDEDSILGSARIPADTADSGKT